MVVSKTERAIEVEECASGKEACLLSAKKRETPADLSKALRVQRAALLARISELDREIIEVEAAPAEDFDSFAARLIASIK